MQPWFALGARGKWNMHAQPRLKGCRLLSRPRTFFRCSSMRNEPAMVCNIDVTYFWIENGKTVRRTDEISLSISTPRRTNQLILWIFYGNELEFLNNFYWSGVCCVHCKRTVTLEELQLWQSLCDMMFILQSASGFADVYYSVNLWDLVVQLMQRWNIIICSVMKYPGWIWYPS